MTPDAFAAQRRRRCGTAGSVLLSWARAAFMAVSLSIVSLQAVATDGGPDPGAARLFQMIDGLDVEHHWPAGMHVRWETGEPLGTREGERGRHTHCSAFVAAAARQAGIYILRPPAHKQSLLANAQYDWLAGEGAARGWLPVQDAVEAQHRANAGWFVVAVYRNPHDDRPGHIAIVRPSDKSVASIRAEGPQVTQAGSTNYRSVALKIGFAGHPAAWGRQEVRFYAHAVPGTDEASPH